ncbi:cysteine dioxygenase type I [Ancylostoma ceylanicum]|uniref:Cysteine dioxygenase n=1 Tax=Ancylostoma ceylanicum TaxID=53326 RepID=A0A0D6L651_9BILA|nr:cysteine dioxygenase type I [Ancylostoma ceylanicum]
MFHSKQMTSARALRNKALKTIRSSADAVAYFDANRRVRGYDMQVQRAHALSWNCDGTRLACGSQDRRVAVATVDSSCRLKCTFVGQGHDDSVDQGCENDVIFVFRLRFIAQTRTCWLPLVQTNLVHEIRLDGEVYSVAWHPQQLMLAFASSGDLRERDSGGVRLYTRNLVDTGNGKYNMIVLCWGPGMCTNIHDHSGSHCFVKMLEGQLKETRFAFPEDDAAIGPLAKTGESVMSVNEVSYMSDTLGLHRMENPSHSENAVSLHVYSPAYDKCFLFDQRTSQRHVSKVTFWSRYGKLSDSADVPFDRIQSCSRRG